MASLTKVFVGGSTFGPPPTDGLLAHYRLEEAAGANNALDSSGAARHATHLNSPGSAAGKVGNCRTFNGTTQAFRSTNASFAILDAPLTLACWFRLNSLLNTQYLLGRSDDGGQGYSVRFEPAGGKIRGSVTRDAQSVYAESTVVISTGTWYFVVMWYDHTAARVYISVNNETPVSEVVVQGLNTSPTEFTLGAESDGTLHFVDGQIDEASVWSQVISAGGRAFLFNGGSGQAWPWV